MSVNRALPVLATAFSVAALALPAAAQQEHSMHGMSGMSGMGGSMSMASSTDLQSPMSQEASGTAWLPSSSPMYGRMFMKPSGDMLMLHGAITPRYVDAGSNRGDRRIDSPNWFMGMYTHKLNPKSQLGIRAMLSLDPLTEGGYGYPLLFQTGESWHGQPLHDRQHPHDLFSELSLTYSRLLNAGTSAYLYAGYPGEPAIGPPTFMHRLIAYDLPDAPIGHHWQDATHITWGVATAGLNFGNRIKAETSIFNGREPDEDRYKPDPMHLDSYSGRVFYNPDANNSFQASYGFQKNPEGDSIDQHRITASWIWNKPLRSYGGDSNFSATLVWGRNIVGGTEGTSDSLLAEADYQAGRHAYFTRLESIQKSGHELVLPEDLHEDKFRVGALTVGYLYDLQHGRGVDTGVGASVTLNTKPDALTPFYGSGTPVGFQLLFRLRPSKMRMGDTSRANTAMAGREDTSGIRVAAALSPEPPASGQPVTLTLTITDADGKPVTGAAVRASVNMTTMDMGTLRPAFRELREGRYAAEVKFSMGGTWRAAVTVTPAGGESVTRVVDLRL